MSTVAGMAPWKYLNNPVGVVVAPSGDLFVLNTNVHTVVKVATLFTSLAFDILIVFPFGHFYRFPIANKLNTAGTQSIVAGTYNFASFCGDGGAAVASCLYHPRGLAISTSGADLYISDTSNNRIRKVNFSISWWKILDSATLM